MNYDLSFGVSVLLQELYQTAVLANTVLIKKEAKPGTIPGLGTAINFYANIMRNVQIRTYTADDKAANKNYNFDTLTFKPFSKQLEDETYGAIMIDGWDNAVLNKDNFASVQYEFLSIARQIITQLETALGTVINGVDAANTTQVTFEGTTKQEKGDEIIAKLADLKFDFDEAGVPDAGRVVVAGRKIYNLLVGNKAIQSAANTGEAGESQALRSATTGEVSGWTIINSGKIDDNALVAYHTEAFVLLSAAPGKNLSAPYSELITDPQAPIDLRANVLGLGARNATGLLVSTFFTASEVTENPTNVNPLVEKVVFSDGTASIASVEDTGTTTAAKTTSTK